MKPVTCLILSLFVGAAFLAGQGLHHQMSMEEVKAAVGEPTSSLERAGRAIWMYPDGGRVEFENDRIVHIDNMPMASDVELMEAAQVAAEQEKAANLAAEQQAAAEAAAIEAEFAAANAEMVEEFSDSIEDYESMMESGSVAESMGLGPPDPFQYWVGLGVQALIGLGLTMVVLKLSFKWTDVHADWGQMFLPALVDISTGVAIRAGAYLLWQTDQLYRLDDGISFFALIVALRSFTHASSLPRAVSIAIVAKLASIVVWSLLSVVLLQSMLG